MSEWAVQLDRVSFTYEGTQREILHEVSLNVKPGEFLTIVGPNGAGKSTLVRTMIGLNRPTSGRVLVEGKDLSKLTVAQLSRTVGFLFQNPDHQLFEDTVYREIAAGPVNMGLPEEQVDQIVKENMDFCSLTPLAERAPEDLSVGEKKRTAVAAVMAMGTNVIVFDEPTTGQTWSNLKSLLPVIERLNAQGRTVIMITHNIDLVVKYGARIAVVLDGRIAFDGGREALFSNDDLLKKAHLTKPAIFDLSQRLSKEYGIQPCFECEELTKQLMEMAAWQA